MRAVGLCKVIEGAAIVVALLATASAGAFAHTLPITKLQTRSWPQSVVIVRVFDQLADALTTPSPPSTDENFPAVSDAEKRAMFADLQEAVAFDPDAVERPVTGLPAKDAVTPTLARLAEIVTIWQDPYWSKHPQRPLSQLSFIVRPTATQTPGLCVDYAIGVHFRPVGELRGPRTEVVATRVDVEHSYHFVTPPPAPVLDKMTLAERQKLQPKCPVQNFDVAWRFFGAPDSASATRGIWLTGQAISQAGRTPPAFQITCYGKESAKCTDSLVHADASRLWYVDDCDLSLCHVQLDAGQKLAIRWTMSPEFRIESIDATETVTVADPIAD